MRLLDTQFIRVVEVTDSRPLSYAILSHTWQDGEVTLQDLEKLHGARWPESADDCLLTLEDSPTIKSKAFFKLYKAAELARRNGFEYIWIDTCCIDKTSSAELSEAINSMYQWYRDSTICYAYIADAPPPFVEDIFVPSFKFRRSRWFLRG